jgi:kinesin family protein 3/17
MVATLGPATYNYDETLSTLLYASRARDIKNQPKINEDPKDALISQFCAEIDALKKRLAEQHATLGGGVLFADAGFLQQLKEQHDAQLRSLMAEKSVNEEQRAKMKEDLDAQYEAQMRTREESEKLKAKIEQMEKSVLVGGVNLVDVAKAQEEELRAQANKLKRQQEEQRRLAHQGEQEEEQLLLAEQKFGSLKEELTSKVHIIKKLKAKTREIEDSIDDMQQQFEREKEEQTTQIRSLNRELKLLKMIALSFIPEDQLSIIEGLCQYDKANGRFTLKNMELAGCHRKVEEEEIMVDPVYLPGVEEAIFGGPTATPSEDPKQRAEAARKKKTAHDRMLNIFALTQDFATDE